MASAEAGVGGNVAPVLPAIRPALALARRAFTDARTRTIGFAYLFAIYAFIQPYGYRKAYPTVAERVTFATSFGNNKGLRIFYGWPYDLLSLGGYSAWRVGGTLAIAAAVFGVLAAVRALRTEEEAGRMEIVLSAPIRRRDAYVATTGAICAQAAVLFLAEFVGSVAGGLQAGGSAYLALATSVLVLVFAGIGAVVCEIAPTRRVALQYGSVAVALSLLLRVIADTTAHGSWLRWLTPLGWSELLRPFANAQPLVLLLPVATSTLFLAVPVLIGRRRDIGSGLVAAHDDAEAHVGLLRSTLGQAFRLERGSLLAWSIGVAAFGCILGVISKSVSNAGIPRSFQREIEKLGSGSILTPLGYISFLFFFFILVASLFSCAQLVGARREEADEHLETLFALPIGRSRWLGGRLFVALSGLALLALASGAFTWVGAVAVGVHVTLWTLLEAGANCLPPAVFYLGVAVLVYAVLPRLSAVISYGVVIATYLWQAVGSLLGAPHWAVELTPFAWVGLVPTEGFRLLPAIVMLLIGLGSTVLGFGFFRRRDLLGA